MRRWLIGILAAAACGQACALDRLFFSPAERFSLEAQRARASRPAERPVPHVTGYVKRSDGHDMIWLDDVPFPASKSQSGRALDLGPASPLSVRSTMRTSPGGDPPATRSPRQQGTRE